MHMVVLIYVDYMVIVGDYTDAIANLKQFLHTQFYMKDLGELSYFLGLVITKYEQGIFVSHRNYALDLLKEIEHTNYKPLKLPF